MNAAVAIIGAGPAGVAAAVQLRRCGIDFQLFEKEKVGGLLHEANWVENFPGIAGGAPGSLLAARLARQLAAAAIAVQRLPVSCVAYRAGLFELTTPQGTRTAARLILACGSRPLPPPPPLDREFLQDRLSAGVLPLRRAAGKTIAIVGGGDAAFDYALRLAARNRVHILLRSATPRALPLLVERCRRQRRIQVHPGFRLAAARSGAQGAIVLVPAAPSGPAIACDRILLAIGRAPALDFLHPGLRQSLTEHARRRRLFLAGDAGNGRFRQAAIAFGDGLRVAMAIAFQEER